MPTSTIPTTTHECVPWGLLYPNPDNLRHENDYGDIEELATSIANLGLLQPLLVVPGDDSRYMVVAGHRRYQAIQFAIESKKLPKNFGVDVMVRAMDSDNAVRLAALLENLQRQGVNVVDEALSVAKLCSKHGYTSKQLQATTGRSASWVSQRMKLARLSDPILAAVRSGRITVDYALQLLQLPTNARDAFILKDQYALGSELRRRKLAADLAATRQALLDAGVAEKFIVDNHDDAKAVMDGRRFATAVGTADQVAALNITTRPMKDADLFVLNTSSYNVYSRVDEADRDETPARPAPPGIDQAAWDEHVANRRARYQWTEEARKASVLIQLEAVAALSDKEVMGVALRALVLDQVFEMGAYNYSSLLANEAEIAAFGLVLDGFDEATEDDTVREWLAPQLSKTATLVPWLRLAVWRCAEPALYLSKSIDDLIVERIGAQPDEIPAPQAQREDTTDDDS